MAMEDAMMENIARKAASGDLKHAQYAISMLERTEAQAEEPQVTRIDVRYVDPPSPEEQERRMEEIRRSIQSERSDRAEAERRSTQTNATSDENRRRQGRGRRRRPR